MINFSLLLCLAVWNVAHGNSARCRNYSSCDVACNFPCVISSICASPCGNKSSNHHGSQSNHGSDNGNHGGNFGSKGGNHGQYIGNYGPQGGNYGPYGGNYGPQWGNYGPQAVNYGSQGGNYGVQGGIYGPQGGLQGGNYGQQGGNYGPQGGNYGPQGGNYGPQGGNYGPQGGNYGPQGGNYGPQGGNYGPQGGNYGPQGGNYGPQGGNYGPQGGNYGPQGGNFGPQGGNYGSQGGNNGPQGGNYGPQGGDIGPQGGNYICGYPCGNNGNDIERDLEFTTISKGYSSGVQDRVYKAFSSTPTWASFWTTHTSNSSPGRAAPLIDFDLNIVIAAFRGTRSTDGYGVEITKVRETRDALVVHVETRDPDPSSVTTQALTQPFHLVQCERLGESKPIKFVPAKYTFTVLLEKDVNAADVLKDVDSLNFVISVQLLEAIKICIVTVDAALVEGLDAAKTLIKQVDGIKIVEQSLWALLWLRAQTQQIHS